MVKQIGSAKSAIVVNMTAIQLEQMLREYSVPYTKKMRYELAFVGFAVVALIGVMFAAANDYDVMVTYFVWVFLGGVAVAALTYFATGIMKYQPYLHADVYCDHTGKTISKNGQRYYRVVYDDTENRLELKETDKPKELEVVVTGKNADANDIR